MNFAYIICRAAMAVVVCKYLFNAFEEADEEELEGKIYEKESRAAQAAGVLPHAVDETHTEPASPRTP
jgi:hypothetical protein